MSMQRPIELEYSAEGDRYHDYCLWEYKPLLPSGGRLRSGNLLMHSLAAQGMGEGAVLLMQAIRQAFGVGNTVWGVKQEQGCISWELYFYDYERRTRTRSVAHLLEVIRPWIVCDLHVEEHSDYFMFSIDLNRMLLDGAPMEELQLYMGNVGSTVSSGICYAVTRNAMTMKNFYFFFDACTQGREIVDKLTSSVYLDLSRFELDSILWPELRECQTIVLANKRSHDGIYFSRITIDQLLFFMRRMQYPVEQIAFAETHRDAFSHLLFDVGLDYRMEDGEMRFLKSAYYGFY